MPDFSSTAPEKAPSLRFLSYNIHGCVGRGGREDPEAVLEVIRSVDADVVALQEVYDHDVADRSFLRGLESLSYSTIVYGETLRRGIGLYGNILMTRLPATNPGRLDISVYDAEPRGALHLLLDTPDGIVSVIGTHLGLTSAERTRQLQLLRERRTHTGEKTDIRAHVLMGDLNEWLPWSRNLRHFRREYAAHSRYRTFPATSPLFALDRIGLDGDLGTTVFHRPDFPAARTASDHRPLAAEIWFG